MTSPFLGEIQLFGFSYAPYGWAMASGQTVAIQQYTALFSLLGTQYGGNGTTNFQLPNFASRAGCNQGTGQGLTPRVCGETFGETQVTLTTQQMPQHTHGTAVYTQRGTANQQGSPSTGSPLGLPHNALPLLPGATPNVAMAPNMIGVAGGGQPHPNMQPYLAVTFAIAMTGVFPSFN